VRVAVDTNALYTTRAGVARYTRGLLGGLRTVADPADWHLTELAWRVENFAFRQPLRAWRTLRREWIWARWDAPRQLRNSGTELLHSTGNPLLVPPGGIRHVVTVHDIGFMRYPERYRAWHLRMTLKALERSRIAHRVICISRFTADELVRLAGFDSRSLRVVYNGCSFHDQTLPVEAPAARVPAEFLLFVGSLEPGKNLNLIRDMYELARRDGVALPDLVIVGARFAGLAGEGAPPPGWHYVGHLSDSNLLWLYQRARALLFPSKYEGFGLPIGEAMCRGCPVICSPVSSLPEVAGEAALMADQDPAAYLGAVQRLLGSDTLREDLVARGREQAAQFTWKRCARETLEVYREAA
jgi:glycosyltransferase involved in cell wall biosynthesis